jgi:predicted naringenin-chalcone synthase
MVTVGKPKFSTLRSPNALGISQPMQTHCFIGNFTALEPAYRLSQEASLAWLAEAHTRGAQTAADQSKQAFDPDAFHLRMTRRLARFGCSGDQIGYRGYELPDCSHTDWARMLVYRLHERAAGEGTLVRTRTYGSLADKVFDRLYEARESPPSDLLHVTCTGYESPSAAQRLVTSRGWGKHTRVTHAYHMGCYATLPALRIASAVAAVERSRGGSGRVIDIVHSELCSLHVNPVLHTPEQIVVQTLFADGFIAYSVTGRPRSLGDAPALGLLALREETLPDSVEAMAWVCSDSGMQMTLARDVPERIRASLGDFVAGLCEQAEVGEKERQSALFAIHPGGPRILDLVRDELHLSEEQIAFSRRVLFARGNVSSATLPHIWLDLLESDAVPDGQPIVSLAFGPGLTLSGAVLRKVSS